MSTMLKQLRSEEVKPTCEILKIQQRAYCQALTFRVAEYYEYTFMRGFDPESYPSRDFLILADAVLDTLAKIPAMRDRPSLQLLKL